MKEEKKILIRDITNKINNLPKDKQNYVIGVMNGILISGNIDKEIKPRKANTT